MDVHPKKQQICITTELITIKKNMYAWNNMLNIYDYNREENLYIKTESFTRPDGIFLIQYSPSGDLIAMLSDEEIHSLNLNDKTSSLINKVLSNECSIAIKFHPNGSILTALLLLLANDKQNNKTGKHSYILRYIDITNKNIVSEISLSDLCPCLVHDHEALSFSPDGTKIMIKLQDRYIILPVSSKVIYHPDKTILIYELLKQYNLPHDIAIHLLEAFKR